jgi:hypothetical protein
MAYYYKLSDLVLPEDDCIIWRYMELWKFLCMLKEQSIFFSRADKQTADPLEGEYPRGMIAELERLFKNGIRSDDGVTYTFLEWHNKKEIPSRLISCWNAHPTETQSKWAKYTADNAESVSIRSTIGRLTSCFHEKSEPPVVWIGKVRYGEEENKLPQSILRSKVNYFLYPFFAKNESWRWENEIRATVNISKMKQDKLGHSPNGCYVKADLLQLIESIWIHPNSPIGFRDQVKNELASNKFGNVEIYQSSWNSLPRE